MKNGILAFSFIVIVVGFAVFQRNKKFTESELDTMSNKHNGSNISALSTVWIDAPNFTPGEFRDKLECLDRNVIYALQKLRNKIGRIDISRAEGAIARTDDGSKNSMHFCGLDNGKKRLSVAIDIHPVDVDLETAYEAAKAIQEIGGVGVYPNWNTPGLHIDLRVRKAGGTIAQWGDVGYGSDHNYVSIREVFA